MQILDGKKTAEEIKKESVDNLNNFFVSKNKDLLVELDQNIFGSRLSLGLNYSRNSREQENGSSS